MVAQTQVFHAPQLDKVTSAVSQAFGITTLDIKGASRRGDIADARLAAYHLAKANLGLTYSSIAAYFNKACHGSVMSGITSVENRLAQRSEKLFCQKYEKALKNLELLLGADTQAIMPAIAGTFDLDQVISLVEAAKQDVCILQTSAARQKLNAAIHVIGDALFQLGAIDLSAAQQVLLNGGERMS